MSTKTAVTARHHRLNPSLFPLEEMMRESIAFLREHEPPEGYFVGFSGGKDSIVTLELCRLAGVKHQAFYSVTGIDPPEVVKFIRRSYPDVTFLRPLMSFWEGVRRKSPPFRMMRWCCDVLKKQPSKPAIIEALTGNPLRHRIMGIRAEESFKRAGRPRIDRYAGTTVYKPIFDWAEWHVWEFIESCGLAYPALYDEGFSRIGCVICPFLMGKNQGRLNRHREKWPAMYKIFERVVAEWFVYHKTRRYSEKTFEEYLAAYYRGFE
jgi:3''-phosphoadenosine 5''-phosphosulfate sulfotransferase (PAPS reductase)/FAD synthetase and related enzymes